jgi:DNA mismatch repair protein MutH
MISPPETVEALLARARSLEGRSLGALAGAASFGLGPGGVRSKGKPGALIEVLLGATGGSSAVHDFQALGVELKTLPLSRGAPLESTYVCRVPAGDADRVEWASSWARAKLSRVLFVPIHATSRKEPFEARVVGRAFMWSPSPEEDRTLHADFDDIMGLIAMGGAEQLTAHVGRALQCRPKAANGAARMHLVGPDGEGIHTVPRGFYLRPSFTRTLLEAAERR